MKYLVIIVLILSFVRCEGDNSNIKKKDGIAWISLEEAQILNENVHKDIFIMVHANWCPKCERLFKESFSDKKLIKELNDNFYPVLLNAHDPNIILYKGKQYSNPNFDKKIGLDQMNSYHELLYEIEAKSIPSMVFLDSKLIIQGTEMGFKPADELRSLMKMYNSNY